MGLDVPPDFGFGFVDVLAGVDGGETGQEERVGAIGGQVELVDFQDYHVETGHDTQVGGVVRQGLYLIDLQVLGAWGREE